MHQLLILTLREYPRQLKRIVITVYSIDSSVQIHIEETGIALIQGVDQYEVVK